MKGLLVLFFLITATNSIADVRLGDGPWHNTWSQVGAEFVSGGDNPMEVINAVRENCDPRMTCTFVGSVNEEILLHHGGSWWGHMRCLVTQMDWHWTNQDPGTNATIFHDYANACVDCPDGPYNPWDQPHPFCSAVFCPAPYKMNFSTSKCEAFCQENEVWDPITKSCRSHYAPSNCHQVTETPNPINLAIGEKLRREPLLSAGVGSSAISLVYFYNSQNGSFQTPVGTIPSGANKIKVDQTDPLRDVGTGLPINSPVDPYPWPYSANAGRLWRHSFEEALLAQGADKAWAKPDGQIIYFDAAGKSMQSAFLQISPLAPGEQAFLGFKLFDQSSRIARYFDDTGRLRVITNAVTDRTEITYDDGNRILRIQNKQGQWLEFGYKFEEEFFAYHAGMAYNAYPIKITANTGEYVDLQWNDKFLTQETQQRLLNNYSRSAAAGLISTRYFNYSVPFISDIYDEVASKPGVKKLYAHFEYDSQGRAIYSGLAGGAEKVTVDYPDQLTRVLTNALGKKSTYSFADFNGVRRLKSVTGEPTATCVKSATQYEYDAAGNIQNEIANGTTLHREYDGLGREILRTQAFGTTEAKTTQTCWHPSLNQPSRVIEPNKITLYDYWPNGQLKSQTTKPRPAGAVDCATAL